ncbi:unnamed protein product [Auanema sp. JU1783]|nr:unnamed protein product [Auanema sp. JU1783]
MTRFILLFISVAACLAHQIPISYTPSLKMQLYMKGELKDYLKQKAEYRVQTTKDAQGTTQVVDYEDMAYMVQITLGTPPQRFVNFIDSASANLWVPDIQCAAGKDKTCGTYCKNTPYDTCITFCDSSCCSKTAVLAANGCQAKHRYNSTASSTYKAQPGTFDISYQTGDVSGSLGSDTFCFYGTNICATNQVFGQAKTIGSDFAKQPLDGIIGLGWPALAVDSIVPPMNNLIQQNKLDQPLFVVYMAGIGPTSTVNGGSFTVGTLDKTNCGDVNWIPLTQQTFWQFKLDSINVGTSYSKSQTGGWQAISDTASTFIGGPLAIVNGIASAVGAKYFPEFEAYFIDCQAKPSPITFTINGVAYDINPKNYIISVGAGPCMLAFFPNEAGGFYPSWMLGPPLIREYCQVYDYGNGRVGMAKVTAQ